MKSLRTRVLAVRLLVPLACAAVFAGSAAAQESRRTVGDWQVVCESGDCRVGQSLANPKEPGIIYGSEFKRVGDDKRLVLKLSFPLGIYLPRGVGLRVGTLKRDVPMTVCLPNGCQALVMMDEPLTAAMGREGSFLVRFYTTSESPGEVKFSLNGLSAALVVLRQPR